MNTLYPASQKNVPCCFLHSHKLLATVPLHRALWTPATLRGRGALPTHRRLRANRMEPCKMCLLRAFQKIHKSTITAQGKPWHYPGLTLSWHPQPEGVLRHWAMWTLICRALGLAAHTAHLGDHVNTVRPSTLFYPSADHWHKKSYIFRKIFWSRLSFMKNNTLFQTVPLQVPVPLRVSSSANVLITNKHLPCF